jgi:NADH:ubiquinone oxidoreductase subunit 6 (subunit J)
LPASLAVIGFRAAASKPVGGLVETSFWLTVSLAVALWNLSRLPTKVHFKEVEADRINVAYDFWTAFLEMFQLSSLLLGVILLLAELFTM